MTKRTHHIAYFFMLGAALVAAPPVRTKLNSKDGLTYVWIPSGHYVMGCSAGDQDCFAWEKPRRRVNIGQGFWIGQTEVTQEAYQRVLHTNPSRYRGARLPVEQIGWRDARAYCRAVGMRLPTEAEWEYAARGGSPLARYGDVERVSWYDRNSGDTTHAVGQKLPNGYGLYDTLGNVWEWVEDGYKESGKDLKILRGGAFFNLARDVRVSDRLWAAPETAHRDMGVRCLGE